MSACKFMVGVDAWAYIAPVTQHRHSLSQETITKPPNLIIYSQLMLYRDKKPFGLKTTKDNMALCMYSKSNNRPWMIYGGPHSLATSRTTFLQRATMETGTN